MVRPPLQIGLLKIIFLNVEFDQASWAMLLWRLFEKHLQKFDRMAKAWMTLQLQLLQPPADWPLAIVVVAAWQFVEVFEDYLHLLEKFLLLQLSLIMQPPLFEEKIVNYCFVNYCL